MSAAKDLTVPQIEDLLRTCGAEDMRSICWRLLGWAESDASDSVHVLRALGVTIDGIVQSGLRRERLTAEVGGR